MALAIAGKCALVPGASMGIGRAIAVALAKEGVKLAVVARRRELLEKLQDETGKLVIIQQDMLAADAAEKVAGATLEGLGGVDLQVNKAGGSRRFTLAATEAQWEEAVTLNFTRHRQLTHRLLPQMMARKWGRITNVTGKSEPEGINGAFAAKAPLMPSGSDLPVTLVMRPHLRAIICGSSRCVSCRWRVKLSVTASSHCASVAASVKRRLPPALFTWRS